MSRALLTADDLERAYTYFGRPYRYEKLAVFASDVDFEELCRLEERGELRFHVRVDSPRIVIEQERRSLLKRFFCPRILDDTAAFARAKRLSDEHRGPRSVYPFPAYALLMGRRAGRPAAATETVFLLEKGADWQGATPNIAPWLKKLLLD